MKKSLAKLKIWQLILGLFLVIGGSTLFIVGVSGSFGDQRAVLDPEYECVKCKFEYTELLPDGYEELIKEKKSFVVVVDQGGCKTADKLREFVKEFAEKNKIKVYKMMFEDMKKTSLHDSVKYYPSVAVISRGKVIGWLRADADEDSDAYNKYEAFEAWANKYIKF